jgi:folylpolyglutamate synthase/dihydropteroate synthase
LQIARALNAKPEVFESVAAAYNAALSRTTEQDLIVCSGSFATVRECMQEIGWQSVEDGRDKSGKIDAKTVRGQIK